MAGLPFDLHKNLAYSSVASPPSPAASGVTLILQTGDGARFPTALFPVTIFPAGAIPVPTNAEIAYCTTRAGDTLTLVRAQEQSSARTIIAGDQVIAGITAKTITDIESLLLVPPMVCQGRLTAQPGVAFPLTDFTAVTSIKFTPHGGNRCAVYSGGQWVVRAFSELSIAVPNVGSTLYDVFVYDNAGVLALEMGVAWNNSAGGTSKRFAGGPYATLLPLQDGVKVKSTDGTAIDATRRYLGTFLTLGAGLTEDSLKLRLLYNYYNRVPRQLRLTDNTTSWAGAASTTYRQVGANAANYVYAVQGVVEDALELNAILIGTSSLASPGTWIATAIGVNGAGAFTGPFTLAHSYVYNTMSLGARFETRYLPTVGVNFYMWLESNGGAAGQVTFVGSAPAAPIFYSSGLWGTVMC